MSISSASLPTICLITPPSIFLLDERVFVNLGILKIAAVLEKTGYPVEMVDLSGIQNFEEAIRDHARTSPALIFGVTSTTPQMPATAKIAKAIRQIQPQARLILGGPHVTLVHSAYKKESIEGRNGRATRAMQSLHELFDVLVVGDGEEAILSAISENPSSTVDANDRYSSFFLNNQKLESLPFPARHLVDMNSYHYSIEGHRATSIIAQLGCPFECGFCGGRQSPMLRVIRTRSSQNIIQEIREIYETYGHTGFMFYDDELNVNPKMVELMNGIANLQKELGVEFRLRGFVKAELFTDQQAEAMMRAGFRWLLTGFESGSPRILTNINKKATREQNTRAVQMAKNHGLKVKALMSVGHPGESRETIMETHDWLLKVRPDDFDVTIITTYPGTPYYDFAVPHPTDSDIWVYTYEKTGDKLYSVEVDYNEVADYYKGDPDGGYKAYVYTDFLSANDLVSLRDHVERDIRKKLNIPFNPGAPAIRYEHSMGQFGTRIPAYILRTSRAAGSPILKRSRVVSA
ncbi:MAG: B12-binding domain-containing radical SAM protein [Candidatus Omnitrophica bacterium]|nr:B12-binding domain-containing radical SAM protein [Candidatus Omnitrophota bacterium]